MYSLQVTNFDEWRKQARELLKRNVHPEQLTWQHEKQQSLLNQNMQVDFMSLKLKLTHPNISREFMQLAKQVSCFRDENRWALLYSIAWRLIYENKALLGFKVDPQVAQFYAMRKAVGRDKHKMEAFVRFRLVQTLDAEEEYFVAWFEPDHLILPIAAPFFMKRFYNMHWSIFTPDGCVHWNQKELQYTEAVIQSPSVEDELEDLWRQYYANIFNPARLKLKAMQSEMPKKYWVNLPEAPLIAELTREATSRTRQMIDESATSVWQKTSKSRFVKEKQRELRNKREGEID